MKASWRLIGTVAVVAVAIIGWNFFSVAHPVSAKLADDSRNTKVSLWAYHQYGLSPSVLVMDLRRVDGDASAVDVLRSLLQGAQSLKDNQFSNVVLAFKGNARFQLDGAYFQKLGADFGEQNPIYTIRTLPENIKRMDGTAAYGTWTGGLLGVVGKQMEDVNQFSRDWYISEMAGKMAP